MPTTFHTFEGKLKWPFLTTLNKFAKHSVNFYPKDDDTMKAIAALKIKTKLSMDDDGGHFIFRRDPEQVNNFGKTRGPVIVVDEAGNPVEGLIGNGSEGVIKLEVYDYNHPKFGKGKAARLEAVKITKLIPYERKQVEDEQPAARPF